VDQETRQRILEAMERAKEDFAEMRRKRAEKIWSEISLPANLPGVLARLTKDELNDIRKSLELKNLTTLKKQELAAELVRQIPAKARTVLLRFDQGRYSLVKTLAGNGGYIYIDDIDLEKVEAFRNHGIVFPGSMDGKRVLVLPLELIETFRKLDGPDYRKIVQRNTEWITLTQGLIHYYGVLSSNNLHGRLAKFTGEQFDFYEFLHVIYSAAEFYGKVRLTMHGFCNNEILNPEEILREQKARPGVDFFPFTKSQLLQAGDPGFVDDSPAINRFARFLLAEYEMNKQEAYETSRECTSLIRLDNKPSRIISFLETRLEFPTFEMVQKLTGEIMHLCNNTRLWILKGYTPSELSQRERKDLKPLPSIPHAMGPAKTEIIDFKTRKKIGRNDPCPCGSGKKYKHCCG
jgi:hypothetical protein